MDQVGQIPPAEAGGLFASLNLTRLSEATSYVRSEIRYVGVLSSSNLYGAALNRRKG